MLDRDLAALYGVTTGNLNLAVRRNRERFPDDFMFQTSQTEANDLMFQIARSSWGGRRKATHAFTEHGVAMLSSVLKSQRAVQMNILIVRAFVRLREVLSSHGELALRLSNVEAAQADHQNVIHMLADEIDALKDAPDEKPKSQIGFRP